MEDQKNEETEGTRYLGVLEQKRREESVRSPTFLRLESDVDTMEHKKNEETEGTRYLEVLEQKRREESVRSPTFLRLEPDFIYTIEKEEIETSSLEVLENERFPNVHCSTDRKINSQLRVELVDESKEIGLLKPVPILRKKLMSSSVYNSEQEMPKIDVATMKMWKKYFLDQAMKYTTTTTLMNGKADENHNNLQLDQNVEAMDWEFLWQKKIKSEYMMWSFTETNTGTVVLQHEKIPTIRIHIEADFARKAEERSTPLLFVEESAIDVRNISAERYLEHREALAVLSSNEILTDRNNFFTVLHQIHEWFNNIIKMVAEVEMLVSECGATLKRDEQQCYIQVVVCDVQNCFVQVAIVQLVKIDAVGPTDVVFRPACETTNEFKSLAIGLPFLRAFLDNPKSFFVPFLQ